MTNWNNNWRDIKYLPGIGCYVGHDDDRGFYIFFVGDHHGERRFYDSDAMASGNYIRVYPKHFINPYPLPDGSIPKCVLDDAENSI